MTEAEAQAGAARTTVGVVAESGADERRVALVPKAVSALRNQGVTVIVEAGAGERALLPDDLYTAAGASIGDAWAADVVVKVAPPTPEEVARLKSGQTLVGFLAPRNADNQISALSDAGVQAFAVEAIPRISRAQAMDALSSQANVAGYKAVLVAAERVDPVLPDADDRGGHGETGQRAGARCRGRRAAGVGHRQAPGRQAPPGTTYARRWPTRSARWVRNGSTSGSTRPARAATPASSATRNAPQQQQHLEQAITGFDVVITTALVPGRPAPRLVTAAAVQGMKPGSVVVDLAGETGGNCELTEPGHTIVRHGVTIASPLNLPATMPEHASELYAKNLTALLDLMITDGALAPDFDDEVLAGACVTRAADAARN